MTVGAASIVENDTDSPKILIGADRLLTTRQHSAIEHEHPETKISKLGERLPAANLQCVVAGGISLGEDLKTRINQKILREVNEKNPNGIGVQHVAQMAGKSYQNLVQDKIEGIVLSSYGLELDDLSRQHQFQDDFLNDILAEVQGVENQIHENLHMLLAGVDTTGSYVYEVSRNDTSRKNDMGYACIGSGTQPAESEYIKSDYSRNADLSKGMAILASALYEAQEASGVGGTIDIGLVSQGYNDFLPEGVVDNLMERQNTIAEEQDDLRERTIDEDPIDWRP